jgi:hypothetical protein
MSEDAGEDGRTEELLDRFNGVMGEWLEALREARLGRDAEVRLLMEEWTPSRKRERPERVWAELLADRTGVVQADYSALRSGLGRLSNGTPIDTTLRLSQYDGFLRVYGPRIDPQPVGLALRWTEDKTNRERLIDLTESDSDDWERVKAPLSEDGPPIDQIRIIFKGEQGLLTVISFDDRAITGIGVIVIDVPEPAAAAG